MKDVPEDSGGRAFFEVRAGRHGRVFADSEAAVQAMWHDGLPRDTVIWTGAPALHLNPEIPTERIDGLGHDGFLRLADVSASIARAIFDAAMDRASHPNAAFALARVPLKEEHLLYRGMMLSEEDLSRPCVIAHAVFEDDPNQVLHSRFNPPWRELLPEDGPGSPLVYNFVAVPRDPVSVPGAVDVSPSLLERISFEPASSLIYRASVELARFVPERALQRSCWLLGVSPLGKEVASNLVVKGFLPRLLSANPAPADQARGRAEELSNATIAATRESNLALLRKIVLPPVAERIQVKLEKTLLETAIEYFRWTDGWRRRLSRLGGKAKHHRAVLRYDLTPGGLAAAQEMEACGIPFCIGQHGVTNEIRAARPTDGLTWETAVGGLFCTYGKKSANLSSEGPYSRGRAAAVGASADMAQLWRRAVKAARPDILYVSTGLYMANNQRPSLRGVADIDVAELEIRVIDELLSRADCRVAYKTYPFGNRYVDPDPVVERAQAAENIDVLTKRVDVRYMLAEFRLIVTSRATSTFGWCLATGRPLLLLDHPEHVPFRDDLRELLSAGLFFVDLASESGFEETCELLKMPAGRLEALWAAKSDARARLVAELLGDLDGGSGFRTAELLASDAGSGPSMVATK